MAKKGTTIRLSDDIWEEIEDYQKKHKLDNKNIAVERMLFERRILSNCMNALNNLNINISENALTTEDISNNRQKQSETLKKNPKVQNALDKLLDNDFSFEEEN